MLNMQEEPNEIKLASINRGQMKQHTKTITDRILISLELIATFWSKSTREHKKILSTKVFKYQISIKFYCLTAFLPEMLNVNTTSYFKMSIRKQKNFQTYIQSRIM